MILVKQAYEYNGRLFETKQAAAQAQAIDELDNVISTLYGYHGIVKDLYFADVVKNAEKVIRILENYQRMSK
jgi:uncharacterized protein (DUF2342 family)